MSAAPHPPAGCTLGRDGKVYPRTALRGERRDAVATTIAALRADGHSLRAIADLLARDHGIRRSPGWVAGILRDRTNDEPDNHTTDTGTGTDHGPVR